MNAHWKLTEVRKLLNIVVDTKKYSHHFILFNAKSLESHGLLTMSILTLSALKVGCVTVYWGVRKLLDLNKTLNLCSEDK